MSFSKIMIYLICGVNTYFGAWCLLNVMNILQTSKYARSATAVFAILFLTMAFLSLYFIQYRNNVQAALWIGIGPWILALAVVLFAMLTGDYN